jgi:hypothetical protein
MAIRSTMQDLIDRVRAMIGDPRRSDQTFEDQAIQDCLDRHCKSVRYAMPDPVGTIIPPGGTIKYLEFWANTGDWEGMAGTAGTVGTRFYNGRWQDIWPASDDPQRGRWTFAGSADPPWGPLRPVTVTGSHYDCYGAAAELLEEWPIDIDLREDIDRKEGDASYQFSQRMDRRVGLAKAYRMKSWPTTCSLVRSDV